VSQTTPVSPAPPQPLRVALLIAHSIDQPLPEAYKMAKETVRYLRQSGLALDVHINAASMESLRTLAQHGCDILFYYGHATSDGSLGFVDGSATMDAIAADPTLNNFIDSLTGAFLFACHSDKFTINLPCPFVSFSSTILAAAPSGFVHELIPALKTLPLNQAISHAQTRCASTLSLLSTGGKTFLDCMVTSPRPWPSITIPHGTVKLSFGSPGISNRFSVDFGSLTQDGRQYPDHDPFVGRTDDLRKLSVLPMLSSDKPKFQAYWVHGDAGIGKTAFLRQHACNIRDLAFADERDPVWLMHVYCFNDIVYSDVEKRICTAAQKLYELPAPVQNLTDLFAALDAKPGVHVWILDDLTYTRRIAGEEDEARKLANLIANAAKSSAIPMQLVVSARFPGPMHGQWQEVLVGPLSLTEKIALARLIRRLPSGEELTPDEVAAVTQIFEYVGHSTVHYKRTLMLAAEAGITYRQALSEFTTAGAVISDSAEKISNAAIDRELAMLDKLTARDAFDYRPFLEILYPTIHRAGSFSHDECRKWFGDRFHRPTPGKPAQGSLRRGLTMLARLGFLAIRKHESEEIFYMPPNQRLVLQSLTPESVSIPVDLIPFRAPKARLSSALEKARKGSREALHELLALEGEYEGNTDSPEAAEAVATVMHIRAAISQTDQAVLIYDTLIARFSDANQPTLLEQVAEAMFSKGANLAKLGRENDAIAVYDNLIARFSQSNQPALLEQVAKAMFNKGVDLATLGRENDAIAAYETLIARFSQSNQPALMEQVASAMLNTGVDLATLGRENDAIAAYDTLIARFSDTNQPALLERVAMAMLNKGVDLATLGRENDAIAAYDNLIARFSDTNQPALLERVAKAMLNKGMDLATLGRENDAIAAYDTLIARFSDTNQPALLKQVAKAMFNKGVVLATLGRENDAIAAYDTLIARFSDTNQPALLEQVAMAMLNKGLRLAKLNRENDAIAAYDTLIARFSQTSQPAILERVAKAMLLKAMSLSGRSEKTRALDAIQQCLSVSQRLPQPIASEFQEIANKLKQRWESPENQS
jgi:tetratricopeptide (TPR) repeat protein